MAVVSPDQYAEMIDRAKAGKFAYPAVNVSSSQTATAALQGFAEAIELVLQGRADATANDLISFQTYQEEHPEATFRLLDEELPDETTVGVIMQQGQEPLLTEVNAILEEMKQDGSLRAIYEEWVGQDITPEG